MPVKCLTSNALVIINFYLYTIKDKCIFYLYRSICVTTGIYLFSMLLLLTAILEFTRCFRREGISNLPSSGQMKLRWYRSLCCYNAVIKCPYCCHVAKRSIIKRMFTCVHMFSSNSRNITRIGDVKRIAIPHTPALHPFISHHR